MEADLQHYYKTDVRGLWSGGLTLRRLKVLLDGLPPESLWWTALRQRPDSVPAADTGAGLDAVRWGTTDELLAALIDATRETAWTVAQVSSRKKLPPPKPFTRPGTAPSRRARTISRRNMDRLNQWRAANRQSRR